MGNGGSEEGHSAPEEQDRNEEPPERLRYTFPIRPPGSASYSRGHHDYPATDTFAPCGSKVVAPTSATVNELSRTDRWDPAVDDPATRGGLYVSLIGTDGVRYYGAHLRRVAEHLTAGAEVRTGQVLGSIGDSGNARGLNCHLHFGISHPTHPGDWKVRRGEVDPYPYLRAWVRDRNRTPQLT
jgi:peptidoglycan LD-endopeptidase LytH